MHHRSSWGGSAPDAEIAGIGNYVDPDAVFANPEHATTFRRVSHSNWHWTVNFWRRHQTLSSVLAMVGCLVVYHHTFAFAPAPPAPFLPNLPGSADPGAEQLQSGHRAAGPPPQHAGPPSPDPEFPGLAAAAAFAAAAELPRPAAVTLDVPLPPPPPPPPTPGLEIVPQGDKHEDEWLHDKMNVSDVSNANSAFEVYAVQASSPKILGRGVVLFITPTVPGLHPLVAKGIKPDKSAKLGNPSIRRHLRTTDPLLADDPVYGDRSMCNYTPRSTKLGGHPLPRLPPPLRFHACSVNVPPGRTCAQQK